MNSPLPPFPPVESGDFGSRLVMLADGRPGLRGGMHIDIREPVGPVPPPGSPSPTLDVGLRTQDSSRSVLEFIASDETLDRYDEIVTASGWKLESYRRNPVFQNAHKYGDVIFTLGKALITEIRPGNPSAPHSALRTPHLFQQVEFAVDVNPMAKIAYGLYRGKFLNAVSVGFIPLKWENGPAASSASSSSSSSSSNFRRKYTEQELLEVSAVGIPANPNALALGLKAGAIEKSDLQDTFDLLCGFLASPARTSEFKVQGSKFKVQGSGLPSDPQPSTPNYQQILALARDLHALLRRA